MENSLAPYVGQDVKNIIKKMEIVQRTSKDGNPYFAIEMTFCNGYTKLLFVNSQELFAWTNALEMLDTEKQIEL